MTGNTISDCISDIAANTDGQLKEKAASPVTFSIAIDESVDITDIAQLAIFIRGVDTSLAVTNVFVQSVPLIGMAKAEHIFGSFIAALE